MAACQSTTNECSLLPPPHSLLLPLSDSGYHTRRQRMLRRKASSPSPKRSEDLTNPAKRGESDPPAVFGEEKVLAVPFALMRPARSSGRGAAEGGKAGSIKARCRVGTTKVAGPGGVRRRTPAGANSDLYSEACQVEFTRNFMPFRSAMVRARSKAVCHWGLKPARLAAAVVRVGAFKSWRSQSRRSGRSSRIRRVHPIDSFYLLKEL